MRDDATTESPRPDSFLRAEDGMITVLSVVTVFGFAVLASLVGSVGTAVNRKIEAQNAADAVALSCSVQRARTLNAVTAVNHLTGELMAVVVLQESLGGWEPGNKEGETTAEDKTLNTDKGKHDFDAGVATAATLASFTYDPERDTPAYEDVSKAVMTECALLDAHRELKLYLASIYRLKSMALKLMSLKLIPYVGEVLHTIGHVLYKGLTVVEKLVHLEWKALGIIQSDFAELTVTPRDQIYKLIPNLRAHSKTLVDSFPDLLTDTATSVAKLNSAAGAVYPTRTALRIGAETVGVGEIVTDSRVFWRQSPPEESTKPNYWNPTPNFAYSQIVRASYPWVNYHRTAILDATSWLVFSDFRKHYRNWSTETTLRRCQDYYDKIGESRIYAFTEFQNLTQKNDALWLSNSQAAEQQLTVLGFSHRSPPSRWTTRFLPATNADGVVAFSQSMVYNANPRVVPSDERYQPVTGWDTLNWDNGNGDPAHSAAAEWPKFGKLACPKVKLNWQAKLVPVTRLAEAIPTLDGKFRPVLDRIDPASPLTSGH